VLSGHQMLGNGQLNMFKYKKNMIFTENVKNMIARCWIRYWSDADIKEMLEKNLPEPNYRQTLSQDGDIWPWNDEPEGVLSSIISGNPDLAYEITLKIIDALNIKKDEHLIAIVAAGPLEDLIKYNSDHAKYRAMYEKLAETSEKHKFVLSNVWL